MYLKRFYLYHSCLNHDPARLMLTCIYVAGKVGRGGGWRGCGARTVGGAILVHVRVSKSRRRWRGTQKTRRDDAAPSSHPDPKPYISQIEEAYIGAEDFCRKLQQDPKAVLNNEVLLLQVCEGG